MDKKDNKFMILNGFMLIITIVGVSILLIVISVGIFGVDLESSTMIELGDEEMDKDESLKQDRTIENAENDELLKKFKVDTDVNSSFLKNYNKK